MTKSQFKAEYSAYRKLLKNQFFVGYNAFSVAVNSNSYFRDIYRKDARPVSIKCWLAFNA